MWSTHEAAQKIAATRDLPYGSARTAAMEYITRTLEREGPESMLPEAYLNLVEAYVLGSRPQRPLRCSLSCCVSTTPTPSTLTSSPPAPSSGSSSGLWRHDRLPADL